MRSVRILLIVSLASFGIIALGFWLVVEYPNSVRPYIGDDIAKAWRGDRTAGEILRYAEKRLSGHPRLEAVFIPVLRQIQGKVERPVLDGKLPTLGKGQQPVSRQPVVDQRHKWLVASPEELRQAIAGAVPGQVIEIQPGRYLIDKALEIVRGGSTELPIVLRAAQPGQVKIEFDTDEGFLVTGPNWVFENLDLKGVCTEDQNCEHAFHVVGKAKNTTIRNNYIEDFNAHVKVNGLGGQWPDDGLVEFNTLINTRPRMTHLPVTPFDLVGASHWLVADNLVSNFVRAGGNQISYGIFMKGGGREGHIERNLVICTPRDVSQAGARVGISFGGGGTDQAFCRNGACKAEHFSGIVSNNIIAHCNDFGIDVSRASKILVAHNTLINTAGVDIRGDHSSAIVYANLLDGRIRARNGGEILNEMNVITNMVNIFRQPDRLDLKVKAAPERVPASPAVSHDFCGDIRATTTWAGAFSGEQDCPREPR